jgi:hypothetical protein
MPFNLPGTLVPLHLVINPRLVLPSIIVKGQSPLIAKALGHTLSVKLRIIRKIFASLTLLNFAGRDIGVLYLTRITVWFVHKASNRSLIRGADDELL